MISGPVYPRTRAGLRELVEHNLVEIEFGLQLVQRDLEFEPGCAADVLAKDAAGRPTFLFLMAGDSAGEFLARVLTARAWLHSGSSILARVVGGAGLNYDLPARFIGIGLEVQEDLLRLLNQCAPGLLEIYQARALRVGGRTRVGIVPRSGVDATADDNPFRVPSGVTAAVAKTLCARFLELMRRVESDLRVVGDRYSRRFHHAGVLLAELAVLDGEVHVRIPAGESSEPSTGSDRKGRVVELRAIEDCHDAVDAVMRAYLSLLASAVSEPRDPSIALSPPVADLDDPAAMAVSLARLRETLDASQLSAEEYSVLGDSGSDDG